ncbi:alpha/beta hydrolase family protein [Corynebacterium lubricantis]|uniref:alpha/beta hydrolase family protein n=1 Tax=Corynebacterium lubricantis TaxID=541095 RepID=UPI00036EFE9E|nr:alpha/beta fold hydrolase [Corynebacterium lubricantis]
MHQSEKFTLTAENGEPTVVTRRDPDTAPRGAVLIAPAIATKARFYDAFAQWLVEQGYRTYMFDYQGYGESARTPLKEVKADFMTWTQDAKTVVDFVAEDAEGLPLTWIGHSLGTQVFAFTDHHKVDKAIFTCGGTGYWRLSDPPNLFITPLLWWVIAPVSVKLKGYFPGKKLKILGDIPGPVMTQWGKWCRLPGYMLDDMPEHRQTFANVKVPITTLTFTDDDVMSAKASAHLESYYSGTEIRHLRLEPQDLGEEKIGHMGLYYRGREKLWEKLFTEELVSKTD